MEFFINPGIVKVNQRPAVADSINDEFLLSKGLLNFRCKQKSSNKTTTGPVLFQYSIDKCPILVQKMQQIFLSKFFNIFISFDELIYPRTLSQNCSTLCDDEKSLTYFSASFVEKQ